MKREGIKIRNELFLKSIERNENYGVIGIEIRNRRIKMSNTLAELSDNICSISYLSKIENNAITPNRRVLKEICRKLDMSDAQINLLLESKWRLVEMVKAYFENNLEVITRVYIEGQGLSNYRFKIIEMIYNLAVNKLYEANLYASELLRLVSIMTRYDLEVFVCFYSILLFYSQNYDDVIEYMKMLARYSNKDTYLRLLSAKYIFLSLYKLNSPLIVEGYTEIQDLFISEGKHELLEGINYIYGIYLLKNHYFLSYVKIFKKITNRRYRRTLYLLAKLIFKTKLKESYLEDTDPMFYYLGLIKIDYDKALSEIKNLDNNHTDITYNVTILKYFLLNNDLEKYTYICMYVLPHLEVVKDSFLITYFLNELSTLCSKLNKYKSFNESYKRILGIKL